MTNEQQKQKIIAAINARGWSSAEAFWDAACELRDAGLIRMADKITTGGNWKPVWVAA